MANTKISDLTASASSLASTDLAPIVQTPGVGPVKMTGLQLAGGLLGSATFNAATSAGTALSGVQITGTAGQFSCTAATLAVGLLVTISGTLGGTGSITGYTSPTTYRISATNGSTTFTLVNASTGAALTTTAGTPTGLTYVVTSPVLNLSQTWNNSNVTFTGLQFNATDTASASGSLLLDLQVGGSSRVKILAKDKVFGIGAVMTPIITSGIGGVTDLRVGSTGSIFFVQGGADAAVSYPVLASVLNTGTIQTRANASFGWTASTTDASGSADLFLTRANTATLQLGAADTTGTTAPTAQFLRVQSWSSSTNNNQTGADFTIQGSRGTGTGAGGSIIFQVAPAGGSSNGVQNAYSTALTIDSTRQSTFAGNLIFGTDNAYDIGASGASRPRNVYAGTILAVGPGTPPASTSIYASINGATWNRTVTTLSSSYAAVSVTGTGLADRLALYAFSSSYGSSGQYQANASLIEAQGDLYYTASNHIFYSGLMTFGGKTSSFPALKRSTTTLQVRLADDSAFGSFQTGGFSGGAPTIKTANYTQLEADYSLIFNGTGSITLTLLAAATYPGKILHVKTIAAQTVVSASSNVKPIDTDTAGTAILAATAGKWAMLQSDGTDWVIMAQG